MTMDGCLKHLKGAGKTTFIHIDFIDELSNTKNAIKYIAEIWKPAGIITTKNNSIKYAN
ncbi:glycerol-3-phosphate responsive antiterminator [Rossellomorea aquimaris]|nr:glycerol-3-phosphate responsive antiterminator [Rossellomorea aquimaris]WRP08878.1 glycerol-3-phosphate responsive antiterminator [Rossellomorea aquimaris]